MRSLPPDPQPAAAMLPELPFVDVTPAVPHGWFVKHSWTLLAPDGQANVIASSEPLGADLTTESYAETQGRLLRTEFPGFRESSCERAVISARTVVVRTFEWTPPDGVQVSQIQLYCVVAGRHGARGVTATATTPTPSFGRYRATFHSVLASLLIDDTAGGDPSLSAIPAN
ncbi:DcrB/PsbP domain-containing protein [Nakamurella leprariae]|uniref:DcrB-related protein n=1 Tax=Nakamurella leprariae TaxID=2803911 RepID=A0A938YDF6_9ACTN|nr:DcrB-related protein [Nakamurella leprariae]MBM9468647.1 DcrB-related protein [Nakamurella leprariae]